MRICVISYLHYIYICITYKRTLPLPPLHIHYLHPLDIIYAPYFSNVSSKLKIYICIYIRIFFYIDNKCSCCHHQMLGTIKMIIYAYLRNVIFTLCIYMYIMHNIQTDTPFTSSPNPLPSSSGHHTCTISFKDFFQTQSLFISNLCNAKSIDIFCI